jgi:hypothetical protein
MVDREASGAEGGAAPAAAPIFPAPLSSVMDRRDVMCKVPSTAWLLEHESGPDALSSAEYRRQGNSQFYTPANLEKRKVH